HDVHIRTKHRKSASPDQVQWNEERAFHYECPQSSKLASGSYSFPILRNCPRTGPIASTSTSSLLPSHSTLFADNPPQCLRPRSPRSSLPAAPSASATTSSCDNTGSPTHTRRRKLTTLKSPSHGGEQHPHIHQPRQQS